MQLDPQINSALKRLPGAELVSLVPIERQRQAAEQLTRFHGSVSGQLCVETQEHVWAEDRRMLVRQFRPPICVGPERIVFLHGGGWVAGSLDLYDAPARKVAVKSGRSVYLPDYPLSPEFPYPTGVNAIADFVGHLAKMDDAPIWLVGDSAGANMALGVSLLLRDMGYDCIRRMVLFYPPVTPNMGSLFLELEHSLLGAKAMQMNWSRYLCGSQAETRRYCDFAATDFRGLPPVDLFLAELDILRPEGELLRDQLERDNVLHRSLTLSGMPHAALHFFGVSARALGIYELFHEIE